MLDEQDSDRGFERRYQEGIRRARTISATLEGPSLLERIARLPEKARDGILSTLGVLDLARLRYDWGARARPKQNPDLTSVEHTMIFLLGGRGGGKTLAGANWVRQRVLLGSMSIAVIGPTYRDTERYMITGEGGSDGILSVFPPQQRPIYKPHKGMIYFHTGAVAYINSAENPDFRGPNLSSVWMDEPAKWRYLDKMWSNIDLALRATRDRLGVELMITGTPVPSKRFRQWVADEQTVTILMPSKDNENNLDEKTLRRWEHQYGGTRLGRQELEGEILTDNPDALFRASILDEYRVTDRSQVPELVEVALAVDPAIATGRDNDATGIIGGGIDADGVIYVLCDVSSKSKPEKWGADVVQACEQLETDTVIGERNRGGDLVAANVRAARERKRGALAAQALKIVEVHATRGKAVRAEPVGALSERGRIRIVGQMPELEAELTEWNPRIAGVSPSRLDALVWLVWHLARLGEEDKPDYRAGFTGLSEVAAKLRGPASAAASGLLAALPRASWSKL